jgi:hypothetical protein
VGGDESPQFFLVVSRDDEVEKLEGAPDLSEGYDEWTP